MPTNAPTTPVEPTPLDSGSHEPPYPGGLLAFPRWWTRRIFTLDLRSLALFRVGMACLILFDLGQRLTDLQAHYSDAGVLPRNLLNQSSSWEPGMWSFHQASGDASFQLALFAVAAVLAVLLLIGYRTRTVAVASWLMLISLQSRNPLVIQGGDTLMRVMLFWSLFLPLGARWSVDAACAGVTRWRPRGEDATADGGGMSCTVDKPASCSLDTPPANAPAGASCSLDAPTSGGTAAASCALPTDNIDAPAAGEDSGVVAPPGTRVKTIASIFTAVFILQLVAMYVFTALHKQHPVWLKGQAVYYALHIELYVTDAGAWLRQFTSLIKPMTWMAIAGEGLGWVLLVTPFRRDFFRGLAVVCFMAMHVAFGTFLSIGIFPAVAMVAWSAMIPPAFWDGLLRRLSTPKRAALRIYYDGRCEFCLKGVRLFQAFALLPGVRVRAAQDEPEIYGRMAKENSWVVIDHYGATRLRFDAVATVLAASPIFFPLAWLARLPIIRDVGDTVYRRVAHDRGGSARFLAWMHLRQAPLEVARRGLLRWLAVAFVAVVFSYVVIWNVRGLRPQPFKLPVTFTSAFPYVLRHESVTSMEQLFPHSCNIPGFWLRVDQIWDMFSPFPLTGDGYYVMRGRLTDKREIDLFKNNFEGGPLTFEQPRRVSAEFKNGRWVKYLDNVMRPEYGWALQAYCRWLCRDWNARHPAVEDKVTTIWVYYMLMETLPPITEPLTEWDAPPNDPALIKKPTHKILLMPHICAHEFTGVEYLPGFGRPREVERLPEDDEGGK